jgi:hypothetical protein
MIHGEAVVMRLLDRTDAALGTEHIGMAARDRGEFDKILDIERVVAPYAATHMARKLWRLATMSKD